MGRQVGHDLTMGLGTRCSFCGLSGMKPCGSAEQARSERISVFQIRIEAAINEALDRCQALGGRRVL